MGEYADGILGYMVEPGRQTGSHHTVRCPSWDGFVQCDTCNTPADYAAAVRGHKGYRVARNGEHSCANCRRRRYTNRREWYPLRLRVFRPRHAADGPGWLPVRVVPLQVFEEAVRLWPRPTQVGVRGAYLLGYAARALDDSYGQPVAHNLWVAWYAGHRAWARHQYRGA